MEGSSGKGAGVSGKLALSQPCPGTQEGQSCPGASGPAPPARPGRDCPAPGQSPVLGAVLGTAV